MRLLFILLATCCLLAGLLFGALNSDPVPLDLYFWQFQLSLGVALLLAVLLGAILAWLMLWLGVIWPMRRRLNKQGAQLRKSESQSMPVARFSQDAESASA